MEDSILMNASTIQNDETSVPSSVSTNPASESSGGQNHPSDKPSNDEASASIEERYNKLRGLAVKLKKKVSDLTEQNRNLESENHKLSNDKDDLQSRVMLMSDSAKKLQTIQSQYDRLQDDVELVKNENKRLMKRLENLVLENDSFKDTIKKEKKEVTQLNTKIISLSEEKSKLENTCEALEKKVKDLNNEIKAESMVKQQKTKECEDLKNSLEVEVKAHKLTRTRLDDMRHDRTSNNVLSLEVANYEKSIETIKVKLDEETDERIKLEAAVSQHIENIELLTSRVAELQESCVAKTNRVTTLEERNSTLESDMREAKLEVAKVLKEKDSIARELRRAEDSKKTLEGKVELLTSEMNKLEEENKSRLKVFQSHVDDLKRETSRLKSALDNSKRETETLQGEFENYKLRAQSVLSKTKVVPSNELEEEMEHYKRQITLLTEKCESFKEKIDSLTREIILLKDERSRASASEEELLSKLSSLRRDSLALMEKYKNQETEMQKLQINHEKSIDKLKRDYEEQIATLRRKHEEEIESLKLEITLKSAINSQRDAEKIASVPPPSSSPPLIEREECEGSESIESVSQVVKNTEQNQGRRVSQSAPVNNITPLDQLLEFSFDEHEETSKGPEDSPEITVYKNRLKHLTELLADAERDIAKLTQLNQLLKEDIRRQKRYVEREKEAVNFEYLKNVVFKFVTLENRDERSRLVPVLDTILKLSPEETHKLNEIVSDSGGVTNKRSWIPVWNAN